MKGTTRHDEMRREKWNKASEMYITVHAPYENDKFDFDTLYITFVKKARIAPSCLFRDKSGNAPVGYEYRS